MPPEQQLNFDTDGYDMNTLEGLTEFVTAQNLIMTNSGIPFRLGITPLIRYDQVIVLEADIVAFNAFSDTDKRSFYELVRIYVRNWSKGITHLPYPRVSHIQSLITEGNEIILTEGGENLKTENP